MLNLEQELEVTGAGYSDYEVRNVRLEGNTIRAELWRRDYHDYTYHFDAKTGVLCGHEDQDQPLRLRPKSQTRPINHFYLHAGRRDWDKESWIKLPQEHFHDGSAAAERMKYHNALASTHLSPFRFMVKKEVELSPIRDYPAWAEFRFATGDWERVPWANEPWAQTEETKHHYAHISKQDDSQIAFWYSEVDACSDAPTRMAPGKYLKRYFGEVLSNEEIRDWAVKVDAEAELKLAWTPDEIYEIYAAPNSPSSCMRYKDHSPCNDGCVWRSGINPVRVYGAGDLALAYLTRKGKVVARALVWPEKKVAGRRYGDIERMDAILIAEGYKLDHIESNMYARGVGGFNGARLLKIRPDDYPNNYVMPYLDYGYRFDVGEEYLTLNMLGAHSAQRIDGLAFEPAEDEEDEFECDGCGGYFDLVDAYSLRGRSYCSDCYDERTLTCDRCGDTQHQDEFSAVNGDRYWCTYCYEHHSTTCDYCDDAVSSDQIYPIYDARYSEGEDPEVHAYACDSCRDHDSPAIQQDVNGNWVDTSTATTCEDCGAIYSGNLGEDECPTERCVEARTTELENA